MIYTQTYVYDMSHIMRPMMIVVLLLWLNLTDKYTYSSLVPFLSNLVSWWNQKV